MSYTTITIGRLTLRETFELAANISAGTDTRTLVLAGQESYPPLTMAQVKQRQEDILGLQNRLVPIRFGTKSDHDGWYRITDVNTSVVDYQNSELRSFNWGINAQFIGPENAVDLESRLTGIAKQNDHGLSGERWHGVPATAYGYYTGSTAPSGAVQRATVDGASATVWRSVPASVSPRWGVSLADYSIGRARVLLDGVERVATNFTAPASGAWVLTNGLVSVSAGTGNTWNIAAWDGSAWDSKAWNFGIGSSTVPASTWEGLQVVRNDYEMCTVRLLNNEGPGRTMLDLTLRRGSRFVEGYAKTSSSTLLAVVKSGTAEAGTAAASSGHIRATSNDAQGNRYVVGSARSFTGLTAQGGIAKTSTTTLDFFIGAEVDGISAPTGDQAANLVSQYLTAMSEVTLGAVR
jgi:hypothetical protein